MAQNDFLIANDTANAVRLDLQDAFQSLATKNSGTSAPSPTYANMWWYETDTNLLKLRNEANTAWVKVAYVDQTAGAWRVLDDTQVTNTSGTQTGLLGDQTTATWETGTGTTESLVSPAKVAAAIEARLFSYTSSDQSSWTAGSSQAFTHGLGGVPTYVAIFLRCTTANNGFSVGDVAGPYAPEGFNDGAGVGYGVVLSSTSATVTWTNGSYPFIRHIAPTGSRVSAQPSQWDYYLVAQRVAL